MENRLPFERVLVAHPERQHSHQLAAALAEAGLLREYTSGYTLEPALKGLIGDDHHNFLPYFRAARYISNAICGRRTDRQNWYRINWLFDLFVCSRLRRVRPAAVIAYENCAAHTFLAAKRLGITTILDAASVHHSMQDHWTSFSENPEFHKRVTRRKDREIELADHIFVCSNLARESYISAGVNPSKIMVASLGVDVRRFAPRVIQPPPNGCLRFVFVGRLNRIKGADVMAAACQRLKDQGIPFELTIVASLNDAERDILENLRPIARLVGRISNDKISEVYCNADCLLVPSRFDSFGLVVPEAMACGLPVIASNNVGARDLIECGQSGWIVNAGDVDSLFQSMSFCATNPTAVRSMSQSALRNAQQFDWPKYRQRISACVQKIVCHQLPPQ